MKLVSALTAGLAGAVVLTVTHQLLHRVLDDAPRMDLMGEEALSKASNAVGTTIPEESLYNVTMLGDIASNSLYYALAAVGKSKHATLRGGLLGLAAGIGGVYLPKHIGLNNAYSNRTPVTKILTVALYTLGGLVSGKTACALSKRAEKNGSSDGRSNYHRLL